MTGQRIVRAVLLCSVPWLLAIAALVLGVLLPDLLLVYLSIGLSVLSLPLTVLGVLQLVRR